MSSMRFWVAAVIAGCLIAVPHVWEPWWETGEVVDGAVEKLTGWAALSDDASARVPEIASAYGIPEVTADVWQARHPRPPAALLAQVPLMAVPDGLVLAVLAVVHVGSVVAICWASRELVGGHAALWAGVAVLVLWVMPPYSVGNMWYVLPGALVAVGWVRADQWWGRALLGLAAGTKLWPVVVIAGMWVTRRYRPTARAASLWAVGLTGVGLLLPGVTPSGVSAALRSGGATFLESTANVSAAGFLARAGAPAAVLVGAGVCAVVWGLLTPRIGADEAVGLSTLLGVLASPLAWPLYWVAAIPALALGVMRVSGRWSSTRPSSCVLVGDAVRDAIGAQHDPQRGEPLDGRHRREGG